MDCDTAVLGTLLGNYRVVNQLGAGGMGVVYLGHHESLGRRVVMKVLQPELSSDAEMVQRFFNEARAATAIRSPGIAQVFDFGVTSDRRAYFVMELLEGESLSARLKQRRFDYAECCRLGRQVANVLQAAHAAGIVHRDLKPANLFLVPDPEVVGGERVKVLDFGIAKLAGEVGAVGVRTSTGLVMGTPHYMSPEQCRSASSADARSDIYSLGCILFEITCGRRPFMFTGVGDIVAAHLHEPPPYPYHLAPGVPPALSALIVQMLAKTPDARPQTMAAVGQALDDILRSLDPSAAHLLTPLIGVGPSPQAPGMPPAYPVAPSAAPPAAALPVAPAVVWPTPVVLAPPMVAPPVPPAIAQPVRLQRPGIPDFLSISTTLRRLTGAFAIRRRDRVRRLTYVLGALVIVGAVVAIAIVLANDHPGPPERTVSYAQIAAAQAARNAGSAAASAPTAATVSAATVPGDVSTPPATTAPAAPPTASTTPADTADAATGRAGAITEPTTKATAPSAGSNATVAASAAAMGVARTPDVVAAECRRYQADRNWSALAQCAVQLGPLDPKLAAELATRATEEARSAPHIAAAQAALRDGALKRARAELDRVWPDSVDLPDLQRAYAVAEAQATDALAAQLDSAKDASCAAYHQVLTRSRAVDPPGVAQEAARRSPCKPKCDADALEARARALFNQSRYDDALDAYDKAYACRPAMALLRNAFIVACNMGDQVEARSYWKQLPPALRTPAIGTCLSHGITEAMLHGP